MTTPRILLATLCLNEAEHLPALYAQHRSWPGVVAWVFVEAADRVYGEANPQLVTKRGLSVDGTTDLLHSFETNRDNSFHVHRIAHGWCGGAVKDQGKVEARQRYMEIANDYRPDFVMVLDSDEFYTYKDQLEVTRRFGASLRSEYSFVFRQRHIFRPPSVHASTATYPLFSKEVVGGYWGVPHVRGWRWEPGVKYEKNHNWLEDRWGAYLIHKGRQWRGDRQVGTPECVHLGYASCGKMRGAKHSYYVARGEGSEGGRMGRNRSMYVECRQAWEAWKEGDPLPHGARVLQYLGPVPECFREVVCSDRA